MDIRDLLIGGISGALSRTVTAPVELARIQTQNKFMPSSSLSSVIRNEGFLGLWKGNFTNCLRIFPQNAINFGIYSTISNSKFINNYLDNKTFINFYSGAVSGMTAMIITYPLENARSRLSLQDNKNHYRNLNDVFRKTPIKDLYKGVRMSIIGFTPYTALNFMFYNEYKKFFNNTYGSFLSGGLAGVSALSITYPTDLIRRRLQLQGFDPNVPVYNGIIDCFKKIVKSEGILGLYRGLGYSYLKSFPSVAVQFWCIDILKNNFI